MIISVMADSISGVQSILQTKKIWTVTTIMFGFDLIGPEDVSLRD